MRVECYAGHMANQRPMRFTLGSRAMEVQQVEDQWYSPEAVYFRVRAEDGNLYVLRFDQTADEWTLAAFRAAR